MIDDYARLPSTPDRERVKAVRRGYVAGIDAEKVGRAAVALGAGRARLEDLVDPGVGVDVLVPVGDEVNAGDAILEVRHRSGRGLTEAIELLTRSIRISDDPPTARPLVLEMVNAA